MKKIVLDKRWKEVVFAGAGFGPNIMMVLMMAYFTDALIPTGLIADIDFWSYGGVTIVSIIIFPILWTLGRCFDGFIDIPLAALTDNIKNKTGKRIFTIIISFLPMLISFVLCWIPVFGMNKDISSAQQIGNSFWIFFWSIIFFASYTLALITFYGSLSDVCVNQTQRARVSAYKSVFDTLNYALVYALIPAVFKAINVPIWQVALYLSPIMLTILIPLFLRKEVENTKIEVKGKEASLSLIASISLTLKSRPFINWLIVNCIASFGLQMFLCSQNVLISGIMNLGAFYAAILNTCAFAPVPIMLYFFNKLRKKKGIRFVFQSALLSFAFAIFSFNLASQYLLNDNIVAKLIIGSIGGVIGSWGIGAFFMVPYLIPTLIASVEEQVTHKNHSAMYFAVQALFTSIVGAIASSLIYNYLKLWVMPSPSGGEYKCGVSLVPLIVAIFCLIGFFFCFKMPKKYNAKLIYDDILLTAKKEKEHYQKAKQNLLNNLQNKIDEINISPIEDKSKNALIEDLKKKYTLRIAKYDLKIVKKEKILANTFSSSMKEICEEENHKIEEESLLANALLFILSAGLFNFPNTYFHLKKINTLGIKYSNKDKILLFLSLIVPFISIYTNYMFVKKIDIYLNIKTKNSIICSLTSLILPCFLNIIAMLIIDNDLNKCIQ